MQIEAGLLPKDGEDYGEKQPDGEDDGVEALVSVMVRPTISSTHPVPPVSLHSGVQEEISRPVHGSEQLRSSGQPELQVVPCKEVEELAEALSNITKCNLFQNKTIKDGDIAPWKDFKKIEQR